MTSYTGAKKHLNFLITAGLRALAAFILFLLYSSVAKNYDEHTSGSFFYFHTIIIILSSTLLFGLQPLIVREGAKQTDSLTLTNFKLTLNELLSTLRYTVPIAIILTIVLLEVSGFELYFAIPILIGCITSATIISLSALFQAAQKFNLAVLFGNLLVPITMVLFLLIFRGSETHPVYLFTIFCTAIAIIQCIFLFNRLDITKNDKCEYLFRDRGYFFAINLATLLFNWGSIIVVGAFSESDKVTQISIAQRVGAVVAFFLFVSNAILAPRISKLFNSGKIGELMLMTLTVNRLLIVLSALTATIFLYDDSLLVFFFGERVSDYFSVIKVICFAHFINVFFGNNATILAMTGAEKSLNIAMISAAIANLLLSTILIQHYGILGVSIAFLFSMCVLNTLSLYFVNKHLGFWLLGGISIKSSRYKADLDKL